MKKSIAFGNRLDIYKTQWRPKIVLVIGPIHANTSLVAACLGRHPDINMLFESFGRDVFRMYGKKYNGNKLVLPDQIHIARRNDWRNRTFATIDRILHLHSFPRSYPKSELSLIDYLLSGFDVRLILVYRDTLKVANSIHDRQGVPAKEAHKIANNCIEAMRRMESLAVKMSVGVRRISYRSLTSEELVNSPKTTLIRLCNYLGLQFYDRMLEGPTFNAMYPQNAFVREEM